MTSDNSRSYRLRWWTLAVLSLSIIIIVIDNSILNVALPTIQRELDATNAELQWMVDAYVVAFAALLFMMGTMGDRFGHAHALRAGMIVFTGGSLWAMMVDSAEMVIAARTIMGMGAAFIMPATLAVIINVFPPLERGKAIGIWAAMSGVGVALGPITGGFLIEHFDWSAIFFINIPIAVVALVAGAFLVPNSRNERPQRFDLVGTVLSAAMLGILVYGLIKGGEWGWTDGAVIGLLLGAVTLGGLFVLWETRTSAPLLDIGLFRNPRFSVGASGIMLTMLAQFGIVFGLTLYMQFVLDYTALETGVRFLPVAAGVILGSGTSHRRVARFGTTLVVGIGFVCIAALMVTASFWGTETPYWILGLTFFGWGFCFGNVQASNVDSVTGAVPVHQAGVGSAMNSVSVQVGGSIGVAALGSVLSGEYASSIKPLLAEVPDLPPQITAAAEDSIGGAISAAEAAVEANQIPAELGEVVRTAASESFMDGWQLMAIVASGVIAVGAIIALRYLPARPFPHHDKDYFR